MHSLLMPADDKGNDKSQHASDDKDGIELDEAEVPSGGGVRRVGPWAVGRSKGEVFAVSRRCRHQLGDLSEGTVDADGCLVCPWHQSRYDVQTGAMVSGPKGFLGYHGRTPGYTQFVLAYGRVLKLRVAKVVRRSGRRLLIR
jgi:nitrite reductase/ring-hydroxylating ferredoxin subunit